MKVGIGVQNESNSLLSGINATKLAINNADIVRADLVLAFCSSKSDATLFIKGIRSVVGDLVPVIGGSAIGIISNTFLSYEGYPVGVAIIESDTIRFDIAFASNLNIDEKEAGIMLGNEFTYDVDSKIVVIFYDSIKYPATKVSPPIMNASPPLIEGLTIGLKRDGFPIVGAGLLGDYMFQPTVQFCGSHIGTQSVVGALLSGNFTPYIKIMHGFTPMDGIYHTITKMEGAVIYEIDGMPIVNVIDQQYGNQQWRQQLPVKRLAIGVNMGEKYGDFLESNYINRLIVGITPDNSGIVLFEPDLYEGMEIQFMIRDLTDRIVDSVKHNSLELMDQIFSDGKKPMFGLYIDCAGRVANQSDTLTEEASELIYTFNQYNTPLLGFYSGVEVAPFIGKNKGLDWTGVLMVIAE